MHDGDPFAHFGEQMRSHEMIEQLREPLLADARAFLRDFPDREPVALIFDADTADAVALRAAFERATGKEGGSAGFVGIASREFVIETLRSNSPAALDWLPESRRGEQRMLPVAAYTRHGVRFAAFPID
ncbi:MAG: hypothetical protein U1F36_11110 [Planctomycetota bacterium]